MSQSQSVAVKMDRAIVLPVTVEMVKSWPVIVERDLTTTCHSGDVPSHNLSQWRWTQPQPGTVEMTPVITYHIGDGLKHNLSQWRWTQSQPVTVEMERVTTCHSGDGTQPQLVRVET